MPMHQAVFRPMHAADRVPANVGDAVLGAGDSGGWSRLRGAAEASVVRAAALNAGSIAAVIIDVRKRRLLSCHVPAGNIPAVTDLGLTRTAIHEARQLRDAEVIFLTPCG